MTGTRITDWLRPTAKVQTTDGEMTNKDWCENEVERIEDNGGRAHVEPNRDGPKSMKHWIALFRTDIDESAYLTHKKNTNDVWLKAKQKKGAA